MGVGTKRKWFRARFPLLFRSLGNECGLLQVRTLAPDDLLRAVWDSFQVRAAPWVWQQFLVSPGTLSF